MRTSHMIYIGAALTSLMCGTLIANAIWPLPQPMSAPQTAVSVAGPHNLAPAPSERPRIDVVFVLDTTGSMGGLIDGAKQTIWSIANRLASGEPRPEIRVGLVAYRDLGDEYVTRSFPLTSDLDTVHGQLSGLVAAGGGDGPEHVNQGLSDAIHGMSWDRGDRVLRLIFLVGDAPPHDDYADNITSESIAREAKAAGITINTIRCGEWAETATAWQKIAQLAGGKMTTIAQDGGVQALATPFDDELAELNRSLAATSLGWGSATDKSRAYRKAKARASLSGESAAAAASYSAKAGRLHDEDLVTALEEGRIALDRVDNAALPEVMQAMTLDQQNAYVDDLKNQRALLNERILETSRRRDAYFEDNKAAGGFDGEVVDMLRQQADEIGVAY
ncbi:MAG: VWA domain-containing protein [Myxococcales bacterium]|nr:VWA domain-containing protein [Myxococcales bacterium]